MDESPNKIQDPTGVVADLKAASAKAMGPATEDFPAANTYPDSDPLSPEGSPLLPSMRRDAVWPELHFPRDRGLPDVDPRAVGDPVGDDRQKD